jgi:hypothetical protein
MSHLFVCMSHFIVVVAPVSWTPSASPSTQNGESRILYYATFAQGLMHCSLPVYTGGGLDGHARNLSTRQELPVVYFGSERSSFGILDSLLF